MWSQSLEVPSGQQHINFTQLNAMEAKRWLKGGLRRFCPENYTICMRKFSIHIVYLLRKLFSAQCHRGKKTIFFGLKAGKEDSAQKRVTFE